MRNSQLIIAVSKALEAYESGNPEAALEALSGIQADTLPDRPEWITNELEVRATAAQAGYAVPAAARDWVALAQDRLRREAGEEILGLWCPSGWR
jgi:hypothetical protein